MFFGGDPFEHFGGGGRMPGRRPQQDADTEEFYNLLGVPKDANEGDIRKAYRKLALKVCHLSFLTHGLVVELIVNPL